MRISFYTLGCKVNQAETGAMQRHMEERGHTVVGAGEPCDAVVINTCTVTAVSDRKSRQAIRRLRGMHPGAVVAVCGCLPETADLQGWDEIDLLAGSSHKLEFAEKLEGLCGKAALPVGSFGGFEEIPAVAQDGRSRAYLKIQDGCENFCTYCIIPRARGACRSLEPEAALREARGAYERGYRELVLTGIEISSYRPSLTGLVRLLCESLPDMRFRLGSLDPMLPDASFADALSRFPNLCGHFHLSVQSGCDGILRAMGRRYRAQQVLDIMAGLRGRFPNCAVTGDLICGFPGETEADFEETLAFIRAAGFARLHIFPYSKRPGTPAAAMPGQLTDAEKRSRARLAAQAASESAERYRRDQLGRVLQVLFESETHGVSENYQEVHTDAAGERMRVMPVRITGLCPDGLVGRLCR